MIKEEELYKSIEELKIKVERIEKSLDNCYKTLEHLWKSFYLFKEKIEIIGLQQKWFMKDSIEYKSYDFEMIQEMNKKYHLNQNEPEPNEEIKINRIEKIQNYLLQNPERYLTGQDIVKKYHVDIRTAYRDMKEIVKLEPKKYKEIRVTTLRNHKNYKKKKVWVNAITHIVSEE